MVDFDRLSAAHQAACQELLDSRNAAGHWEGKLSSSALSTATAVSALALVRRQLDGDDSPAATARQQRLEQLIFGGLDWLAKGQNPDGGWGDTDRSLSNIATTMLVRAAFQLTCVPAAKGDLLERAVRYIRAQGGLAGLRARYGRDKTFAVPILTNCALAGLVSWKEVSPLPFELACFPQSWFRFLRLPVVSYAIPALVAIGQARYFHRKPRNPLVRLWRGAALERSLRVLEQMQPASGGFLEATPLTSFVVMSLASIGQARHPVARRGLEFILDSVREDGSWPIDTNLATWVTTLSLNALETGDDQAAAEAGEGCAEWLLDCQCREVHPYTGAAPGGWGWSDLSGSVPDADDTPGALLAIASLAEKQHSQEGLVERRLLDAAALGVPWLLDLQNSDGGWPTFCRGWGKLPFDRSGADLTAHALRALHAWRRLADAAADDFASPCQAFLPCERIERAIEAGLRYLARRQQPDGSWTPLWFGNQHHPREENPIYGTARVLLAYADLGKQDDAVARRGLAWLAGQQRPDGGWGIAPGCSPQSLGSPRARADAPRARAGFHTDRAGFHTDRAGLHTDRAGLPRDRAGLPTVPAKSGDIYSTVEETALAIEALLAARADSAYDRHVERGLEWLLEAVESDRFRSSSPIGFYFAKLWYYETLYPVIFTVAALGRAVRRFAPSPAGAGPAYRGVDRRPLLPEPTLVRPSPARLI